MNKQQRPAAEAELRDALNRLQEVDVKLGLGNTADNLSLYANLLNNFLARQAQTPSRIRRCMAQGDWTGAQRLAHTLKGVAATLGASAVAGSAATLEQLLSEPSMSHLLELALADTELRLGVVLGGLQPLASQLAEAIEAGQSRLVPNPMLLHTIAELMAEDDARAVELWVTHEALLKALVPNGKLVDSAIRNFDFEEALQLLRAA